MAAKLKQAKTIIVFQPRAANMLGRASVVETALIAQPKMRFVGQVEVLKGGRKANEAVREFWVACRGSAFGYTV